MAGFAIAPEDPRAPDVRALLERHLAFAAGHTPPEDVHALDVEALTGPDIAFFGLRRDGGLLAVGALRHLDARHGEIKSMHTAQEARGQGAARALLDHLLATARARGYRRVSLETSTHAAFAPARSLYAGAGFVPCAPFADYVPGPESTYMTLENPVLLGPDEGERVALGPSVARFLVQGDEAAGRVSITDTRLAAGFPGPQPHLHREMTDMFYVLEGTLTVRVGDEEREAGPGAFVLVPPGVVHTFANRGDLPARMLNIQSPAGLEQYLKEVAAESGPPDPARMAELASRYDFVVAE